MNPTINIALIGQSNAVGTTGPLNPLNPLHPSPIPDPARAKEYLFKQIGTTGGTGSFVGLYDPMSRNKTGSRLSNTGSLVPALAERLLTLGVEMLNVSHYAVSGTAVSTIPGSTANQHWGATGALRPASRLHFQKMLDAQAPGATLDWLIVVLGETDFYANLTRYATTYALFPDGYICAEYPEGYSNPTNKVSMYELYRGLFLYYQEQFPGLKVLVNATGDWPIRSVAERAAGALARVMQRELAATMTNVYYCSLPTTFSVANGRITNHDNQQVHYSQLGQNELGVADADLIYAVETAA